MRYLLRSTSMDADFVKHIDVLCLDGEDKAVERRYSELVRYRNFRLANLELERYFGALHDDRRRHIDYFLPDALEKVHRSLVARLHVALL